MRTFPCLKGNIGDWSYYLTTMRLAELVKYVGFAEQIFPRQDLDQIMQRDLTKRSVDISNYLLKNEQRFLPALLVAAVGGEPKFVPASFGDEGVYSFADGKLGFLRFDGSESYYVLDGQHRLAAIKDALKQDAEKLSKDEASIILVWHTNDEDGRKRARRLFTTVNRYARKTTKTEDLVFDEDNPVDIYTRRMVREHPFFKERTKVTNLARQGEFKLTNSEALRPEDKYDDSFLFALITLRRLNEVLLKKCFLDEKTEPQVLPDFDVLEEGYSILLERWTELINRVEPWTLLRDDPNRRLNDWRRRDGGHPLVRPIAIVAFVTAAARLFDTDQPRQNLQLVANYFADLTIFPWRGLLWKEERGGMHDGQARRRAAEMVYSYYLTGLPEKNEVVQAWQRATGREIPAELVDRNIVVP